MSKHLKYVRISILRFLDYLLVHTKGIFKLIFGDIIFISEPIFKMFVILFKTFWMQKDDRVIFFWKCLRKGLFQKRWFLKDG